MTRRRLLLLFALVAVAASLGGAGAAHACNLTGVAAANANGSSTVHPGDTVRWNVGGISDPDQAGGQLAHYTVSIRTASGTRTIAEGDSAGPTVGGSFTMPDAGGGTHVTISVRVDHADNPQGGEFRSSTFSYSPAPGDVQTAAPPATNPSHSNSPSGSGAPSAGGPLPGGSLGGGGRLGGPGSPGGSGAGSLGAARSFGLGRSSDAGLVRGQRAFLRQAATSAAGRAAREVRALQRATARGSVRAGAHAAPRRAQRAAAAPIHRLQGRHPGTPIAATGDGPAIPAAIAVGLALLTVIGMGAATVVVLRRRGSGPATVAASLVPPWVPPEVQLEARARDVFIEAELQEIIAEERARRVSSAPDEEPGRTPEPVP